MAQSKPAAPLGQWCSGMKFQISVAFGLLPARMVFPHFDRWKVVRGAMLTPLRRSLGPEEYALGVDEETALIGSSGVPAWNVMGRGTVSVIRKDGTRVYKDGEQVLL